MNGSEKQVKWAEDIINSARETIRRNIEIEAENAAKCQNENNPFNFSIRCWKRVEWELNKALSDPRASDAKIIIDHRNAFDGAAMIKQHGKLQNMLEHHPEKIDEYLNI